MTISITESPVKKIAFFWAPLYYIILIATGYLSPVQVLLLYAVETLIIGIFHFIKMTGAAYAQQQLKNGIFIALFFALHYGMFCLAQTYFFFDILKFMPEVSNWHITYKLIKFIEQPEVCNSLLGMIVIYALKTWDTFFSTGMYRKVKLQVYMFQPYIRIFIQQFVALFPFFMLGFIQQKIVAAIVLVVLRSAVDFFFYMVNKNPESVVHFLTKNEPEFRNSPQKMNEFKAFIKTISGDHIWE